MDRDEFISTVYCLVCEHYQVITNTYPLRRGGFAPALSDEAVMTRELGGEYFKLATDKEIFAYFRTPYAHFFPQLTARTLVVRPAANVWHVKAAIQPRLTQVSGQAADPVPILDTLPLPVCGYPRSSRDRCFKSVADYGQCAAQRLDYSGFKLGLRIARSGMILPFPWLPARPHDLRLLEDLGEGFAGLVPADKGFIAAFRHARLEERHGVVVVTPPRRGMTTPHPPTLLRLCAGLRKGVETVGAHLTERFAVARMRVHDLWHFHHRLIRKVLAHTVGVFVNLQLRRPPLDLDGLVTV
jgi:DDE family transposase